MSLVTPTLNLPTVAASTKPATPPSVAASATPAAASAPAPAPPVPSTTVTLSPQAQSAMAAASHPPSPSSPAGPPSTTAPDAHDGGVYDMLKTGISDAVNEVEDAIASGAHAVVDGVETTLSTAHKVAKGIVELPFAAVAKACDGVGALIDAV